MELHELKTFEGKHLSSAESTIMNPVTAWLNPKMLFVDERTMECEFLVRPEMADPLGILHGSIRSALLCDVLGILPNHPGDRASAITTGMNIDFIGKVYVGEKVMVVAKGSTGLFVLGTPGG